MIFWEAILMLWTFCGSGHERWSEDQRCCNYYLVITYLYKRFLFRTRKCPWYQSLHQNSYLDTFHLALSGSVSDLSSVEGDPALYHSTHLIPRPGPTNLAFHADSYLPVQRIQINVGINWATFTQFWLVLVFSYLLCSVGGGGNQPFFMLLTVSSPGYTRTESGTSSTEQNDLREHKSSNMEPGNTNMVVARVWNRNIFHRFYTVIFV